MRAAMIYPRQIPTVTTPLECAEIFQFVSACEKIPGDMAEAGVFRGGTAAIMLGASPGKKLHLFDTFSGLPHGDKQFSAGEYCGSLADVRSNLAKWSDRIVLYPGLFPDSAPQNESLRFSFVHLDLDLHASTLHALEWFWPRMVEGGVLLSHDYPYSEGVVRAFEEFFSTRAEAFFPLAGNQCVAVRV